MHRKGNWDALYPILKEKSFMHFSFDFWRTIAFSNPQFKTSRTELIAEYNAKINPQDIVDSFSKIGRKYNMGMEESNTILQPEILYEFVLEDLNISKDYSSEITEKCYELFMENPPIVDRDFIKFIESILHQNTLSISITSNTAFVPGRLIQKSLNSLCERIGMNYFIFSDEINCAKPHKEIFDSMIEHFNLGTTHYESNIIHLGDNEATDVLGAKRAGISSFHLIH